MPGRATTGAPWGRRLPAIFLAPFNSDSRDGATVVLMQSLG
jgi:hypothetical protein